MFHKNQEVRIKHLYGTYDGNGTILGNAKRDGYWRVYSNDMILEIEEERLFDMEQWTNFQKACQNVTNFKK